MAAQNDQSSKLLAASFQNCLIRQTEQVWTTLLHNRSASLMLTEMSLGGYTGYSRMTEYGRKLDYPSRTKIKCDCQNLNKHVKIKTLKAEEKPIEDF